MARELNFIFKNTLDKRFQNIYRVLKTKSFKNEKELFENLPELFTALTEENHSKVNFMTAQLHKIGKVNKNSNKYEEIKSKLKKIKSYLYLTKE